MATALITTRFHTPEAQFTAAFVAALATTTVFCLGYVRTFGLRPVLRPIEDLIDGTKRVAAGDLSARLLVTSDDELGELVASFNHMVRGLAERERLRAAFGSYLDPALVARLLSQGEDVFAGEEVEVTVFFADIRNFTAFAEGASPREVVARLNALFEMIVPVLRKHHGHANKFMGDGVLAVFGAPEATAHHADDALAAAIEVQRRVHEQFGEMLRIGIGINTGPVIAGTIGGGGKLEFTLIGDPVNVAARVEELTKGNADAILLTQATVDALACPPATLVGRGTHLLRGKSTPVDVYALQPMSDAAVSA
jgi:class 3 adenylate cyclase